MFPGIEKLHLLADWNPFTQRCPLPPKTIHIINKWAPINALQQWGITTEHIRRYKPTGPGLWDTPRHKACGLIFEYHHPVLYCGPNTGPVSLQQPRPFALRTPQDHSVIINIAGCHWSSHALAYLKHRNPGIVGSINITQFPYSLTPECTPDQAYSYVLAALWTYPNYHKTRPVTTLDILEHLTEKLRIFHDNPGPLTRLQLDRIITSVSLTTLIDFTAATPENRTKLLNAWTTLYRRNEQFITTSPPIELLTAML